MRVGAPCDIIVVLESNDVLTNSKHDESQLLVLASMFGFFLTGCSTFNYFESKNIPSES